VLCREHGQQLTALAAEYQTKHQEQEVSFWGTVKETGVDDVGLYEFYNSYYTFPLYRDVELQLYTKAFGSRKIALTTWNPLRLWRGYKEMGARLEQKKIDGNLKGEGMIQGGVLIFGASGKIEYMYEENVGEPLQVNDIRAAVNAMLLSTSAKTSSSTAAATEKEL
jgi:AhpC/TSA antioxidant enzyme